MIYADYAATSPILPEVQDAMQAAMQECWANPSSPHGRGRIAKASLEEARKEIAALIGVKSHEIVFTGSGSESNSLAILGSCAYFEEKLGAPGAIGLLAIEHHCTLKAADALEKKGWNIEHIPVDSEGRIDMEKTEQWIAETKPNLLSVQWGNSEIGTLQPIAELAELCREHGVRFHSDAVQTLCTQPLRTLPDLLSFAPHKFGGPKGVGVLIVQEGNLLHPIVRGGGQEFGLRSGTENVPGAVGSALALKMMMERKTEEVAKLEGLRTQLIESLSDIPCISISGSPSHHLPHIVHLQIDGHSGEMVVMQLDQRGICASTGSACSTGAIEASHVLTAIGCPRERLKSGVRLSFGMYTTSEEVERIAKAIHEICS